MDVINGTSTVAQGTTLTQDQITNWLLNYITFWSSFMSQPDDWSHWNGDPGNNIPAIITRFQSFLASISMDQFKGLASVTDNSTPPLRPIIGQIGMALILAPGWIWTRLNYLLPVKGTNSDTLNWLFGLWDTSYNLSMQYATIWLLTPVTDRLNLYKQGSDSDIQTAYTDPTGKVPTPTNLHSIGAIRSRMTLTGMLLDQSNSKGIPDPTPAYIQGIVNTIVGGAS